MKKRVFVDTKTGIIVDRTWEFAKPDPEIKVTFPGGYYVRFWIQRLTNQEYIKRAMLIRQEDQEDQ
jgi:hypothetical protein